MDPFFLNTQHVELLVSGKQNSPQDLLGIVSESLNQDRIVLFRPGAQTVFVELQGKIQQAEPHHSGIFSLPVMKGITPRDYRVYHQNGLLAHDPYAFPLLWGDVDSFLFHEGTHQNIYERMGAIPCEIGGIPGVWFVVWAPHAQRVSVIGDFNGWHGLVNPLHKVSDQGVWELFVPGLTAGSCYKWEMVTESGQILIKSDPYGKFFGPPPQSVSIVVDDHYEWSDQEWLEERAKKIDGPMNIYEVHMGSWRWQDGKPLNYRGVADQLALYCKQMHYTHVELLPVTEHPLNESWGYQTTGYYAPTSRYGSFQDLQYFIDTMHQHGIGVILDWVPGHFPTDSFAMSSFDGSPLYEYTRNPSPLHPHWHTYTFDYSKPEVCNFLLGSALFWIDKMHVDGIRVDAVSSMLYLDYGRNPGEWTPNRYGGRENLDAVRFLQQFNTVIHEKYPGVLTFAEESTTFPKITASVEEGGLGFDYKWNMGWMHDTLHYFEKDFPYRPYHQSDLTFPQWYAFSERFLLPFSHDEVVHGKRSLIGKMPGDAWRQFAQLRLLLGYHICQPGKKLLFMGGEFGHGREWAPSRELDWELLDIHYHQGVHLCSQELNALYEKSPQLWEGDHLPQTFQWIDFSDHRNGVIAYLRFASQDEKNALLCVHHFGVNHFPQYLLPIPPLKCCALLINTDDRKFGGSGKGFREPKILTPEQAKREWESAGLRRQNEDSDAAWGLDIEMPPSATLIFSVTLQESYKEGQLKEENFAISPCDERMN